MSDDTIHPQAPAATQPKFGRGFFDPTPEEKQATKDIFWPPKAAATQPEPTSGNWIAAESVHRLARELDVAMNGEAGAASAPSLCDVVAQAVRLFRQPEPAPMGAIVNGRVYADRLEATGCECEGGPLTLCNDWVEFRRCFEHLAQWVQVAKPPAAVAAEDAREANPNCVPQGFVEYIEKNYKGDVFFSDPAWHAARIWRNAMYFATPRPAPAVADDYAKAVADLAAQQGMTTEQVMRAAIRLYQAERMGSIEVVHKREQKALGPAVAAEAGQGERERFEAWWLEENLGDEGSTAELRWLLKQDDDGDYFDDDTSNAWRAWQACATQPAQPLSDEQIEVGFKARQFDVDANDMTFDLGDFRNGVRFAEHHHGIQPAGNGKAG